jgi:3'-phosphoadenosine 5'-phosphosulfate (PAPS) 3'-phosphatase
LDWLVPLRAIGYVLYRHNIAETSNDNMVNAIQDIKETSGETYNHVKKSLQEWNTKYKTNKSGEVVEVADKTIEKYINSKLAEYGRLNTKK